MDLARIINTPEVLREVAYQNMEFNLFDFYDKGKSAEYLEGACGFITRSQYFYCYSDEYHSLVFENVGSSIFDDGSIDGNVYYKIFTPYFEKMSSGRGEINAAWRYTNAAFGVVSIQLLLKNFCFVWVPEVINSFQKNKIIEFSKEMKKINEYLKSNNYSIVNVSFSVMKDGEFLGNYELDDFLNQIDSLVDDGCNIPYERKINDYTFERHL